MNRISKISTVMGVFFMIGSGAMASGTVGDSVEITVNAHLKDKTPEVKIRVFHDANPVQRPEMDFGEHYNMAGSNLYWGLSKPLSSDNPQVFGDFSSQARVAVEIYDQNQSSSLAFTSVKLSASDANLSGLDNPSQVMPLKAFGLASADSGSLLLADDNGDILPSGFYEKYEANNIADLSVEQSYALDIARGKAVYMPIVIASSIDKETASQWLPDSFSGKIVLNISSTYTDEIVDA